MKTSSLILLAASCSLLLGTVSVSPNAVATEVNKASSEKQAGTAVTFRKSLLQLVRSNMGPLGEMAKGNIPMNADVIAKNAQRIEFLADMMHDYFDLDTTAYPVKTDAKDDVWKEHADFTSKVNDLVTAAADLQELVANNQEGDYGKGIGALGATCKACHDDYKKD
ncbi:MAG: cytochrome c556 [Alphaproteobacteria bacterium]|jgi:cytochrome c556